MGSRPIIAIDAGHGGLGAHGGDFDPGCLGNGIVEAEWTLKFSEVLIAKINESYLATAFLVRPKNDQYITLDERAGMAQVNGADFCLAIHVNSSKYPGAHGSNCLYLPGAISAKEVAYVIARSLPGPLKSGLWDVGPAEREGPTSWPRAYNLLSKYEIPCVLVECGYASNVSDAIELEKESTRYWLINSILCGVAKVVQLYETKLTKEI